MFNKTISDYEAVMTQDFAVLWSRHKRMVFHWANRATTVTGVEVEDLVAEGMIMFHQQILKFESNRCTNPETFNFSHQIHNNLKKLTRKFTSKKAKGLLAYDIMPFEYRECFSDSMDLLPVHHRSLHAYSPALLALNKLEKIHLETVVQEFSFRQRKITEMLQTGNTQKQMAEELKVNTPTIRLEIADIRQKVCKGLDLEFHRVRGFALEGV